MISEIAELALPKEFLPFGKESIVFSREKSVNHIWKFIKLNGFID
jgi:hypothetical protein